MLSNMTGVVRRAVAVTVVLMFLTTSVMVMGRTSDETERSKDGLRPLNDGLRGPADQSATNKVSGAPSSESVFGHAPVAVLTNVDELQRTTGPRGNPGSGWTYDILISDQAWNQYNDGFQSMEVDPTNNNDIYIVYESWTSFASGTDQWCLAVRRSTNGGETWSPEIYVFYFPVQINGVYPDMKEPDLAIGNDGMIWITYTLFAYDGPSRNIIDMQLDVQYANKAFWGSPAPWTNDMVTQAYGGAYNVHRLPTISIDQPGNVPVITAMSYDAVAATQSSVVAWQPGATEWDGYEVLGGGPVIANYVQYPCQDSGTFTLYLTAMNYFEAGGVFDMRIWSSADGMTWTALTDIYDAASVHSFYKPSIAATQSGTDYVMCAATYTNNPSDQSLGDLAYAYSLNGGGMWDSYSLPQANYQRMPYVQEDFNKNFFMMTYRQEDGGSVYTTNIMFADNVDLTTWYPPEAVSDTGAYQASNWFAHVTSQERPGGGEYACIAWSDLRDAADPITETSQTHVVYSTYGSRWTIDTDPTGLDVIVDGQTYTAPQLFNWPAGYSHTLEAPAQQTGGGGETYLWDRWSDTGARVHTIDARYSDATLTAYYLELMSYGIPLHEGWNLLSLPYVQQDEAIQQILSGIWPAYDFVRAYNETLVGKWLTYYENRPPQLNTLHTLDHKMGFWIYINAPGQTLTMEGFDPVVTEIPLHAGWNLVGYPSMTPVSVGLALGGSGADEVMGYDGGAPYHIGPLPGSYLMQPGEGYWVHVPADTVWTVNW